MILELCYEVETQGSRVGAYHTLTGVTYTKAGPGWCFELDPCINNAFGEDSAIIILRLLYQLRLMVKFMRSEPGCPCKVAI